MLHSHSSKLCQWTFIPIDYSDTSRIRSQSQEKEFVIQIGWNSTKINVIHHFSNQFYTAIRIVIIFWKREHIEKTGLYFFRDFFRAV